MAGAKRRGIIPAPKTSAYDASWRRLHPQRAAEERGFRVDRAARDKVHAKRDRYEDGGTAETRAKAARVHQGSLARLYMAGHLTADQLAASQEIRQAAERLGADVRIGTFSLETRVDQSRVGGAVFEKLGAVRAEVAYSRWRLRPGAAVVVSMVTEDLSLSAAAKLFRTRNEGARAIVSGLLDAWSEEMGTACREIDQADLVAAQAGLL